MICEVAILILVQKPLVFVILKSLGAVDWNVRMLSWVARRAGSAVDTPLSPSFSTRRPAGTLSPAARVSLRSPPGSFRLLCTTEVRTAEENTSSVQKGLKTQ